MPGLGPIKIISLKHPKKNGKGLLFLIFCRKPDFALKVWENLEKNENTLVGFEPSLLPMTSNQQCLRPLGHECIAVRNVINSNFVY